MRMQALPCKGTIVHLQVFTLPVKFPMRRIALANIKRMNLRVAPEQKATLMRAAALRNTDLTDFILRLDGSM